MSSLDFNDVLQARQHLHGIVRKTPFEKSAVLSDRTNMAVYLKAVGVAALLHNRWSDPGRKVGIVLSGGNLDYQLLRQIIADHS